jgi:adenylate kinase
MATIGVERQLVSGYGDLPQLSLADRIDLQTLAAERVSQEQHPVAIAAHLVVQAPEGYVEGLPASALSQLHLTGIIIVVGDPDEICARHARRAGSVMREDSIAISLYQERVRQEADRIGRLQAVPVDTVINLDGGLDNAINSAMLLWRQFGEG